MPGSGGRRFDMTERVSEFMPLRIYWDSGTAEFIDQRRLPYEEVWVRVEDARSTYRAIKDMVLRGAPLIGVAGALGIYLEARRLSDKGENPKPLLRKLLEAIALLKDARPTAVNLSWALDKVKKGLESFEGNIDNDVIVNRLYQLVSDIIAYERDVCDRIAENGALLALELRPNLRKVLTHCNTGALATPGIGTALGIIRRLHHLKGIEVWVDETRPYLQGSRLTAWELQKEDIPHRIISDSAACYLMSKGEVDLVVVGADRIASNGDTANKIGTLSLAVCASRYGIPMVIAAPESSIDKDIEDGSLIEVELRAEEEVLTCSGVRVAPKGSRAFNPAFDVTPSELITAIVTEKKAHKYPFRFL